MALGGEGATTAIEAAYREDMTFEEAEDLALSVLRQSMEESISSENIDVARVTVANKKLEFYNAEELGVILGRLPAPELSINQPGLPHSRNDLGWP